MIGSVPDKEGVKSLGRGSVFLQAGGKKKDSGKVLIPLFMSQKTDVYQCLFGDPEVKVRLLILLKAAERCLAVRRAKKSPTEAGLKVKNLRHIALL